MPVAGNPLLAKSSKTSTSLAIHVIHAADPLSGEARADRVAADLMHRNVSVSTAEPFATTQDIPHAIRLALGAVDLDVLRVALHKVSRVLHEQMAY